MNKKEKKYQILLYIRPSGQKNLRQNRLKKFLFEWIPSGIFFKINSKNFDSTISWQVHGCKLKISKSWTFEITILKLAAWLQILAFSILRLATGL